jgi:clan AA aspartic protease
VNAKREATVSLNVFGSVSGNATTVMAVVDTGFDDALTLPIEVIASLGLVTLGSVKIQLADGSAALARLFEAELEWHGQRRTIDVQLAPGSPLLGTKALAGSRLTISVREDGPVLIEEE